MEPMDPEPRNDDDVSPVHRAVDGLPEYESAVDQVIGKATSSLRVFDSTLTTGFNSRQRYDAVRQFLIANRGNTLRIVVHDAQHLDRNCPRLLMLLRQMGHAITIHETTPLAKGVYDPFVIADDRHFAHRFHFDSRRGLFSQHDPIGARALIEHFDEIWEASSPALSATTLGL
jgi:hypothetical protein